MNQIKTIEDIDNLYDFVDSVTDKINSYKEEIGDYQQAISTLRLALKSNEDISDGERIDRKRLMKIFDCVKEKLDDLRNLVALNDDGGSYFNDIEIIDSSLYDLLSFSTMVIDTLETVANHTDIISQFVTKADLLAEGLESELYRASNLLDTENPTNYTNTVL